MREFDVFISFKNTDEKGKSTKDVAMAKNLYDALVAQGITAFFSEISVLEIGQGDYRKTIDSALDKSRILVAVGTSYEHLTSKWVEYEYATFHEDILSGIKPEKSTICSYISGIKPNELPRPLRNMQTFTELENVVDFIKNNLGYNDLGTQKEKEDIKVEKKEKQKKIKSKRKKKHKKNKQEKKQDTSNTKRVLKKIFITLAVVMVAIIALFTALFIFVNYSSYRVIPVKSLNGTKNEIRINEKGIDVTIKDIIVDDSVVSELSKLDNVTLFTFENCKFSELDQSLFTKTNIRSISIKKCTGVEDISILNSFKDLHSVDLADCNIKDEIIEKLSNTNITSIDISDNKNIKHISFMAEMSNLSEVDISGCSIEDVSVMGELRQLEKIKACDNKITDINVLSQLKSLEYIDFSQNNIESISAIFKSLKMNYINLSYNNITDVSGFRDLTVLTEFYLSSNDYSSKNSLEIVDEFCFLKKSGATLLTCDLDCTNLPRTIKEVLCSFEKIERLSLIGCDLGSLDFLENNTTLKALWAPHCNIENIDGLRNEHNLQLLSLDGNNIENIDVLMNVFTSDENVTLSLSENNIRDISPISAIVFDVLVLNDNPINNLSYPLKCNQISFTYTDGVLLPDTENVGQIAISDVPNDKRVYFESEYNVKFGTFDINGEFTEDYL